MILYHAGGWTQKDVNAFRISPVSSELSALVAYSERTSGAFKEWFSPTRPQGPRVFMDSGAFPVFMGKATVDLDEYCRFLQRHAQEVTAYAALDVIGDAKASEANLRRMLACGLAPIPTYHKGSDWDELVRLASEHPYIALGGLAADVDNPGQRATIQDMQEAARTFLDEVFHRLHAASCWPVKIHAFGATAQPILERFPFYSADSTAAIRGAGFGRVQSFHRGRWEHWHWTEDRTREVLFDAAMMGTEGSARQARIQSNFIQARKAERYLTDLWATRGVSWS
jgi:hypothetical protein